MKKLMIAAAIVCAAALSHGAALDWGLSGIPNAATDPIKAASCYFVEVSSMDAFNAAADKWAYVDSIDTKGTGTLAPGRGVINATGSYGDYAIGAPVQGFIIAFDATHENYAVTTMVDFLAPAAGNPKTAKAFATDTAGWQANSSAAPEPTSGLLLLLGVAGLALKRKRA